MKLKIYLLLLLSINKFNANDYDLTIIGYALFSDGLGRIAISLAEHLQNELKINFINTRNHIQNQHPKEVSKVINNNGTNNPGKVIIFTDSVYYQNNLNYKLLPKNDSIKISYSMFETSKISQKWVDIFNYYFDMIVVPDDFLIDVYKNAGVKIPIFVLPLAYNIEDFLNQPIKQHKNDVFTFGCSASFDTRKNHMTLVKAFIQEFKNNKNVKLKINGRFGDLEYITSLKNLISSLKVENVDLTSIDLGWPEYIKFMTSLDCYVSISKGEGFSIPPRESLALGIPCILTNNTAQKTICNSGFVNIVNSNILEPAFYRALYDSEQLGFFYNCEIGDVRRSLTDVYNNYQNYLHKAQSSREWVKQYSWSNLKPKYINLVKPKQIILGNQNIVTNDYLMTNSEKLYNKYKKL